MHKLNFEIFILLLVCCFIGSCNDKTKNKTPQKPTKQDLALYLKNNCFVIENTFNGSTGTGFALLNGLIATNKHIITPPNTRGYEIKPFKFPGMSLKAQDIFYSNILDLALIKVNGLKEIGINGLNIYVDNPKNLYLHPIGSDVYLFGNPLGLNGTFSEGVVSSHQNFDATKIIQFTAPASPGNSGGPLVDDYGNVVGIASMQLKAGQNLNFAIPGTYLYWLCQSSTETDFELKAINPTKRNNNNYFSTIIIFLLKSIGYIVCALFFPLILFLLVSDIWFDITNERLTLEDINPYYFLLWLAITSVIPCYFIYLMSIGICFVPLIFPGLIGFGFYGILSKISENFEYKIKFKLAISLLVSYSYFYFFLINNEFNIMFQRFDLVLKQF